MTRPKSSESARRPEHFALTGRSVALDRRINAVRVDIADVALAGAVVAAHYAAPVERICATSSTAIRAEPVDTGEQVSELLHGEGFCVLDLQGDWAWGWSAHDHYVGYVATDALTRGEVGAWRVMTPDRNGLSMGSRVREGGEGLLGPGETAPDPVALAEAMLGAPYLMGGRSIAGIDCSGLVQVTLGLGGIDAPRDSDMQAADLGRPLRAGAPLMRGDLVFWSGHVGIMVDRERLIHATGFHHQVVIEALDIVAARIGEAPSVRRP